MTDKLSAEDVAKELSNKLMTDARLRQNDPVETIKQALEEFAAEKVEETVIQMDKEWNETCKEARADALEEASRVCNSMKVCGCKDRILSLKDRKI